MPKKVNLAKKGETRKQLFRTPVGLSETCYISKHSSGVCLPKHKYPRLQQSLASAVNVDWSVTRLGHLAPLQV